MALQARQTYINLPVRDLNKSVAFFSAIGFDFNKEYTDENATCMIINENTFVMLLVKDFFQSFTKKELTDATQQTEVIMAISANSREQVDEIAEKALAAGGTESNNPADHGFMYTRSFQDLNGHLWEVMFMDDDAA